jgi:DNA invertase Pin-like site-specific DNA recombinase
MARRRTITPNATLVQAFTYAQQALPIDKPIVQYIRQSTTKQLKRNKQSYELQDTDESIIKIDSDQGKSGTKRRDERTGLDQLYALIEQGKVGAVAAFDVSRLYRVLSRAEYGAFCDMVLERKIPVVTFSRIYWPTRVDNDQLNDDFKAAAMFIEEIIKGKLLAAKHRHIQYDASYGGGSIPFGYIVTGMGDDTADRKHYTIYEPHAILIRWLFKRFKELGGNLPLLARELVSIDFRFPSFDTGISPHVGLHADKDGTYPLRTRAALISTFTNKAYIGWYEFGGMLAQRVSKELGDEQGYRDNTKQLVALRKDRLAIEEKRDSASSEVEDLEDCQNLIECAR